MDEECNLLEWSVDALSALLFASAAAWAGWQMLMPSAAALGAVAAFGLSLSGLRLLPSGGRFRLPAFATAEWLPPHEVLELTEALPTPSRTSHRVVPLFPNQPPLPSAGELRDRIEQHLRERATTGPAQEAEVILLGADASAALRQAFGELKRSLG
jgi:hypothetical protein